MLQLNYKYLYIKVIINIINPTNKYFYIDNCKEKTHYLYKIHKKITNLIKI
jgi:hypothetical protein